MATMLNGAAVMDGALLLIAANETCPQPQTSEHLAAVEIMKLQHLIILQNKIDLIRCHSAVLSILIWCLHSCWSDFRLLSNFHEPSHEEGHKQHHLLPSATIYRPSFIDYSLLYTIVCIHEYQWSCHHLLLGINTFKTTQTLKVRQPWYGSLEESVTFDMSCWERWVNRAHEDKAREPYSRLWSVAAFIRWLSWWWAVVVALHSETLLRVDCH